MPWAASAQPGLCRDCCKRAHPLTSSRSGRHWPNRRRAIASMTGGCTSGAPADGTRELVLTGLRPIHPTLRDKPILHLDATLRPELTAAVLPALEVQEVDAAAPHMSLRLVVGKFSKSALCLERRSRSAGSAAAREPAARGCRLRRLAGAASPPGRVLVVTYKGLRGGLRGASQASRPGTSTPLPGWTPIATCGCWSSSAGRCRPMRRWRRLLVHWSATFPQGGYVSELRGVRMRDGSSRAVRVRTHSRREGRAPAGGYLRRRGPAGSRTWARRQPHRGRSA